MTAAKNTSVTELARCLFWRRNIGRGFVDRVLDLPN